MRINSSSAPSTHKSAYVPQKAVQSAAIKRNNSGEELSAKLLPFRAKRAYSARAGVIKYMLNLGMRLAAMGERVVLADADFGLNNIDVVCGVENLVTYDIVDAIEGRCRTRQALVQHPEYPNLFILASNHTDPGKYISPQAVRLILDNLAPRFDYILIDSPAGIEGGFHRAVAAAEEALVVTTSSLRDADKVIAVLKSYKLKSVDLVINMVRGDMIVDGEILSPGEISEILKIPLIGIVPQEDGVFLGEKERGSGARKAFKLLAGNIAKGTRKIYNATYKYNGFFGSIRRNLKKSL